MAYGIKITGRDTAGNDFTVLDSELQETRSLAPTFGGLYTSSSDGRAGVSGTSANPVAIVGYHQTNQPGGYAAGDLVFMRPSDTVKVVNVDSRADPPEFQVTGNYVILKAADTLTQNVNGTDYGLLVKNTPSSGSPVTILDSRKMQSNIEILKSYEPASLTGGKYDLDVTPNAWNGGSGAYSGTVTTQNDNLIWDGTSQTDTQFKNTYVAMLNSYCFVENDGETVETRMKVDSYFFDHSNRKIYYVSYYESYLNQYGGSSIGVYPQGNFGNVIVGEFKA